MNFLLGRLSADNGRIWFQNTANFGSWKVDVTESLSPKGLDSQTAAIRNGEVELGVRPNAVIIFAGSLVEEKNTSLLSGIVSQVEYHGGKSLIRVNLCSGSGLAGGDVGGTDGTQQKVVVETGRGTNIRPGDKVHVTLDASQVHVFDRHSGKNLKLVE